MEKGQGRSYPQLTFTFLHAAWVFQFRMLHRVPPHSSYLLHTLPDHSARSSAFLLWAPLCHFPGLYPSLPRAEALHECILSPQLD